MVDPSQSIDGAGPVFERSSQQPSTSSSVPSHAPRDFGITSTLQEPVIMLGAYDMKSLSAALNQATAGTGEVKRILASSTFRPRLPGLTKLLSQLSKEGQWQKGLEVFEALPSIGVTPDTTITNAVISACDKGGQWEKAMQIFNDMERMGLARDAITYSAVISALSKGRQWAVAIEVFNHMNNSGVECDAVTCCSLITAMDKGGQWQLAEQVFVQMYQEHPQFSQLLDCLKEPTINNNNAVVSSPPPPAKLLRCLSLSEAAMTGGTDHHNTLDQNSLLNHNRSGSFNSSDSWTESPPQSHDLPPMPQLPGLARSGSSTVSNYFMCDIQEDEALNNNSLADTLRLLSPVSDDSSPTRSLNGSDCGRNNNLLRFSSVPAGLDPTTVHGLDALDNSVAQSTTSDESVASLCHLEQLLGEDWAMPSKNHHDNRSSLPDAFVSIPNENNGGPYNLRRTVSAPNQPQTPPARSHLMRTSSLNRKKSAPNRVCCNALLAAYSRAVPPQWQKAVRLLSVMWKCGGELCPDIVSYNTVMKACGNAHQVELAFQIYHLMKTRGIEPSVATFGTLISISSDAQMYGRVKEAWGWLQQSGLAIHITCVNSYLSALIKEDCWEDALKLFQGLRLPESPVKPNAITFNILMSGFLTREQPERAKQQFEDMYAAGVTPTVVSYNTLISAYAKLGQWGEAVNVLQHMSRPNSGCKPTGATFNAIFATLRDAAVNCSDVDKQAIGHKLRMVRGLMRSQVTVVPDVTMFRNMLSACINAGEVELMVELTAAMARDHKVNIDPPTANAVLDCLVSCRSWSHCPAVMQNLLGCGVQIPTRGYQTILVECGKDSAWKAAHDILTHGCPDREVLKEVLAGLQNDGHLNLLLMVMHESEQQQQQPVQPTSWAPPAVTSSLQMEQTLQVSKPMSPPPASSSSTYTSTMELLVVPGWVQGLQQAVKLCCEAHEKGIMTHFTLPPQFLQFPAQQNVEPMVRVDVSECSITVACVVLISYLSYLSKMARQGIELRQSAVEIVTGNNTMFADPNNVRSVVIAVLEGKASTLLGITPDQLQQLLGCRVDTCMQFCGGADNPAAIYLLTPSVYRAINNVAISTA